MIRPYKIIDASPYVDLRPFAIIEVQSIHKIRKHYLDSAYVLLFDALFIF